MLENVYQSCQRFGHTAKTKEEEDVPDVEEIIIMGRVITKSNQSVVRVVKITVWLMVAEVVRREKEIQQVRIQNKVTYTEAVKTENQE